MAGSILNPGVLQPNQGGLFGNYSVPAGGIFAALMDAGSRLSGSGTTDNFARYHAGQQDTQARQQLIQGLTSSDPATRQQAYALAALNGIDTKPFEQQQATQALPKLLQSMQATTQDVPNLPAPMPNGVALPPTMSALQIPGKNLSDALTASGSPELQAQYAPQIIQDTLQRQEKAVRPATLEEKIAAGLDPKTPAQVNSYGQITPITDPNQVTAYQAAELKHGDQVFGETQRHNRQTEATSAANAQNNNPFGKGMTGKAYAVLSEGAKDPAKRGTPEYMTAWQILSKPHVDPDSGTIVYPDLSAYQPPTGMAAQGGQPQQPRITAFAPPNPSQAAAASAGYANRLADASKQIDANESALTSLSQHAKAAVPVVGNYFVSPEYQQGDQAERNFINAQLRRESGAAIAESEFANARKQYIPQPGDSKQVLDQKRAARAMAARNMQLSAGNTLLPPGVFQNASPPRNAPTLPQEQGFGTPAPTANLPRLPAKAGAKIIRYDAQGNRLP
jgi:hypothetical protein